MTTRIEPGLTDPLRFLDEDKPLAFALHCAEVREALSLSGDCCGSCHDDWDDGSTEYEYRDASGEYQIWARVCCSTSRELDLLGIEP